MDTKEIIKKYKNKGNPESQTWDSILKVMEQIVQDKINNKENEIYQEILKSVQNEMGNILKWATEGAKSTIAEVKTRIEGEISRYIANRKIEIRGEDGKDYVLTSEDMAKIAGKIEVPIVEKIIEKVEVIKEQPIVREVAKEITGDEIVEKANSATKKILIETIKNLREELDSIKKAVRERGGGGQSGGGMGNTVHESKALTALTTSVKTAQNVSANGYAIWVYYQGQMVARGVGYTMGNDRKTINLLFTPIEGTFLDIIYIR